MSIPSTDVGASADPTADCGCPEYSRVSRRGLFRGAFAAGAGLTATAAYGSAFVETSYAATRSAPAVMVVLSMRGAVDGMSLVVPHGDPIYYQARPGIAVPSAQLLAKDGFFGLHPNLAPLLPPASLEYTYAYGRAGLFGRYRGGIASATVFEPWPFVPGDISWRLQVGVTKSSRTIHGVATASSRSIAAT